MRLEYGKARIEFLAVKAEVEALLAQGYTRTAIYQQLAGAGRIRMGFSAFRYYLRPPAGKSRKADKAAPPMLPAPVPASEAAQPTAEVQEKLPPRRIQGEKKPTFSDSVKGYDWLGSDEDTEKN